MPTRQRTDRRWEHVARQEADRKKRNDDGRAARRGDNPVLLF